MEIKSWANWSYIIKDVAWFDELELEGWDIVSLYYFDNDDDKKDLLREVAEVGVDHLVEYFDVDQQASEVLIESFDKMVDDFKQKTGLTLDVIDINGDAKTDGNVETGFHFIAHNVESYTLPGKRAVDAGKVELVSWVDYA